MTNTAPDLDFLALDITAALCAQHLDVRSAQVRAALPAFLAALAPQPEPTAPVKVLNGDGTTKHTCTPDGRALPFGRKAAPGECARCDELLDGAAPRADRAGYRRAAHQGYPTDAERATHRRSCIPCSTGRGVCTAGEW